MKKCYCQRGKYGIPGDYMPIKETSINMGILGKGSATLAIIGIDSKLCFDMNFGGAALKRR